MTSLGDSAESSSIRGPGCLVADAPQLSCPLFCVGSSLDGFEGGVAVNLGEEESSLDGG